MIIKLIILGIFCIIGFGVAYCIGQYNTKTNIECEEGGEE
ncbi:unnamed protein product [marine sediment metagenome]|uniref:Uncharacterized protein n=1 Tax=marine sediment metagenome TaxID=412755 RepID=X1AE48_9ZZZZ